MPASIHTGVYTVGMLSRGQETIRFAVGSPQGPHSPIWRLWVPKGKSDVYIAARSLAAAIKLSLHESGQWQHSFTAAFRKRESMTKRHMSRWTRPDDLSPGVTLAYRVIVPWSSVTLHTEDRTRLPEVVWVPQPAKGSIVEFQIWLTAAGALVSTWPGHRSRGTVLVGKVGLANGGTAWVTALEEPAPDSVLQQVRQWREWWGSNQIAKRSKFLQSGIRALLFGSTPDGSRTYIDVDLTEPEPPRRRGGRKRAGS